MEGFYDVRDRGYVRLHLDDWFLCILDVLLRQRRKGHSCHVYRSYCLDNGQLITTVYVVELDARYEHHRRCLVAHRIIHWGASVSLDFDPVPLPSEELRCLIRGHVFDMRIFVVSLVTRNIIFRFQVNGRQFRNISNKRETVPECTKRGQGEKRG